MSPLSLAFKGVQSEKKDVYNTDLRSSGNAISFVDTYCAAHPDKVAADGAGEYFKVIIQR